MFRRIRERLWKIPMLGILLILCLLSGWAVDHKHYGGAVSLGLIVIITAIATATNNFHQFMRGWGDLDPGEK